MELIKSKKAQGAMEMLGGLGIGIATLAIVLTVAFMIMAEGKDQIEAVSGNDSAGYNATSTMQNAVSDIPGWVPIVVITAIGSILIMMVRGFGGRK